MFGPWIHLSNTHDISVGPEFMLITLISHIQLAWQEAHLIEIILLFLMLLVMSTAH